MRRMTPPGPQRQKRAGIIALILSLLVVLGGITAAITNDPGPDPGPTPAPTATGTPAVTPAATPEQPGPPGAPDVVAPAGDLQGAPGDLRDVTPETVPGPVLEAAEDTADTKLEDLPPPVKLGGAQGYSCRPMIQPRGYGAYRSRILMFALHYTVSANVTGWSDVLSIVSYLNRVGLGATFVIDFEGNCAQALPLDRSPYTQGFFNPYVESVEIIATGRETRAQWLASPLIRDGILAALVRDRLTARALPLRFVNPNGCAPLTGYTDHNALECGNDHHDVTPAFPYDVFDRQVKTKPRAPIVAKDRRRCKKVHAYRDRPASRRRAGAPARQAARLKTNRARGLKCLRGDVRRLG